MVNHLFRCKHTLQISGKKQMQDKLLMLVSVVLALLAVTAWSYWRIVASLLREWQTDDYSAGQLVPLIALFLLWRERKNLRECLLKPCWLGGIALLILAQTARFFGLMFMFQSIDNYSLVLSIAGLVLMVAGWEVFRRVLWIILFLFLMLPLPGRVHNMISGPLQNMASTGSVFLMEAFGVRVSQQGNVMMLNQNIPLAVAEACSGLRMLTAFIIIAAFVAYMVKRSRLKKAVILISSIPVAVICNIVRIFVTAVIMLQISTEAGEKFFHDFAGLVMMPIAVLLLFGELWLLDKLIIPEPDTKQEHGKVHAKPAERAFMKKIKMKKQHV